MTQPVVHIIRDRRSDHGTEGRMIMPGFSCFTLELPWRDNLANRSCIPPGRYETQIRLSPRFGRVYWVMRVPGRTYILKHAANLAGDVTLGLKSQLNGCIALGKYRGILEGQRAVLCSRPAVRELMERMAGREYITNIIEQF